MQKNIRKLKGNVGQPALSEVQEIHKLSKMAADSAASYEWEIAHKLYTQALEKARDNKSAPAPELIYELLDGRSVCSQYLGDLPGEVADLVEMTSLAERKGDRAHQIESMIRQVIPSMMFRNLFKTRELAESALNLIHETTGDRLAGSVLIKLEADGLVALGYISIFLGDARSAQDNLEKAVNIYRSLSDRAGEATALRVLALVFNQIGERKRGQAGLEKALKLFRDRGDKVGEGNVLNAMIMFTSSDLAHQRDLLEQALAAFNLVGNRNLMGIIYNNLGLLYFDLGLYYQARFYSEQAVAMARKMKMGLQLGIYSDTLGRIYLAQGELERAGEVYDEGLGLSQEIGERKLEAYCLQGKGRISLAFHRPTEAREIFLKAADLFDTNEQAISLAWLGIASLELGEMENARQYTRWAIDQLRDEVSFEFAIQDIFWQHYRVLKASNGSEDEAWKTLDQARQVMLDRIHNLSDDGLRRNFFNKVEINRLIIREWLEEAKRRAIPLTELTSYFRKTGGEQKQFRRLIDIGVRLNARHEADVLYQLIINEIVELIGSERAALILLDEQGKYRIAATYHEADVRFSADAFLEEMIPMLDKAIHMRASLLHNTPEGAPELEQHSVLYVPLMMQDKLVGMVYADLSGIYGRFTSHERDLLNVLANQAAVAIENLRLYQLAIEKARLERELQLAREMQTSLLPTEMPIVPGWELAALWHPARQVSGDFYDFTSRLPKGWINVVIADVSDKGMPAALFMAITRTTIRASLSHADSLSHGITAANALICSESTSGVFVTLFCMELHSDGSITYVNAGHNPPLLCRADGSEIKQLKRTGMALGVDDSVVYTEGSEHLQSGDMLLLYTDGVTDAKNAQEEFFGEERLQKICQRYRKSSAQKIADALDNALDVFTGGCAPFDDVTAVVLKRLS